MKIPSCLQLSPNHIGERDQSYELSVCWGVGRQLRTLASWCWWVPWALWQKQTLLQQNHAEIQCHLCVGKVRVKLRLKGSGMHNSRASFQTHSTWPLPWSCAAWTSTQPYFAGHTPMLLRRAEPILPPEPILFPQVSWTGVAGRCYRHSWSSGESLRQRVGGVQGQLGGQSCKQPSSLSQR